ncbi:PqqD family protein [Salinibacter ruber]|uniref:PqqD family protein n=1 Tax=Salinibacter ruber TaxID=146919 RepID=UPI00207482D3|nr:PqqD family protein [Salinibacter ruber]
MGYEQVEKDCETLAETLSQRVGTELLSSADFLGIPRGGLIVLGMLSYALNLPHGQFEPPASGDAPLVVVDDCALTGSRFRRFLQHHPDREVIFAPLYAHPELCATIEREEPRVTACVNAQDLHDYAPEELGEDHSEWQAQWHQRHSDERYWIGRTEHLCFPWGEADTATWNPKRKQVEQGLSVVPPEHRLKNRPGVDSSQREPSASVQVQPAPTGPIRPSPAVLFGQVGNHTIVANPEADVCIELGGTAAAMWHALVEHGTIGDTMGALRQAYSVGETTLRADLVDFAKQLAVHDLLHVPDGSFA